MSYNYYPDPWVRCLGVSCDNPDLSDLIDPPDNITKAYCTSIRCVKSRHKGRTLKHVEPDATDCPHCGHALLWTHDDD